MENVNHVSILNEKYEIRARNETDRERPIISKINNFSSPVVRGVFKVFYYGLILIPFLFDLFLSWIKFKFEIRERLVVLQHIDKYKADLVIAKLKEEKKEVHVKEQAYEEALVLKRKAQDKIDEALDAHPDQEVDGALAREKEEAEKVLAEADLQKEAANLKLKNVKDQFDAMHFQGNPNFSEHINYLFHNII